MTDAPKWRTVGTHGQPKPEDYPLLVVAYPDRPTPAYVRWTVHAVPNPYGPAVKWVPLTLPEGDEPPPLPKPFKPMEEAAGRVIDVAFVLDALGSVQHTRHGVEHERRLGGAS